MVGTQQNGSTIELTIHGMHCAGCVSTVENALNNVPGVVNASVNLATQRAHVLTEGADQDGLVSDLTQAVRKVGYHAERIRSGQGRSQAGQARRRQQLRRQRLRIMLAIVLGAPVMVLHLGGHWVSETLGITMMSAGVAQAVLTCLAMIAAAGPMLAGALRALMRFRADMDLLVSLGATVAFVAGMWGLVAGEPSMVLFDSATMITLFVAVGKHLETRARGEASAALENLMARVPGEALLLVEGHTQRVPIDRVAAGDALRLHPDSLVPVDGEISAGHVVIDESMLTGESLPVERKAGSKVFGGTRIVAGTADMRATARGEESTAARIVRLTEEAQAAKTPWQRLADRVAAVFVPVVLTLALITFGGWFWFGHAEFVWALKRAIAVLVVACPCAMGLAIPTAVLVGTTRAAERGILLRNATALEAVGRIRQILLDKTGTLTVGRPILQQVGMVDGLDKQHILCSVAAVEQYSDHPFAKAVIRHAQQEGIELGDASDVTSEAGGGMRGQVDGHAVIVGSVAWLRRNGVHVEDPALNTHLTTNPDESLVWVAVDGRVAAWLAFADEIHPESAETIAALKKLGVQTQMLSGDRRQVVSHVARQVGITNFLAELTPEEKLRSVRDAAESGVGVAMVGDGINDAPALASADVGIAIGTGADVAREAADVCLVRHSPRLIAEAIRVSRRTVRVMKQNLIWAFVYNAVMLPIAAFTPLPPAGATAAMMLSSLSVVGNSLRLRRMI
jgi:heavy metal translocating P-type ATPase